MVAFAPTVPSPNIAATSDPEYTSYRWSRPIGPFAGDKSSAESIEGAGKVLEGGVKAADTLVKNSLTNSIEDTAGNVRDKYSANLDQALALANAGTDPSKKLDLLASTASQDKTVPKGLQSLPDLLAKMDTQNANGKVSETKYRGDLSSLAKQYRAAWPGYREYIDSQFSRVTDTGPANDYIRTQVASLNAAVGAMKEGRSKLDTLAVEGVKNIKGFDVTYQDWKSGKISDAQLTHQYNLGMSWKFDQEKANSEWDVAEKGSKLKGLKAEQAFTSDLSSPTKSIINNLASDERLDKVEADLRADRVDPVHAQQLSTHFAVIRSQIVNAAIERANNKGWAQDMDPKKLKELVDGNPDVMRLDNIIKLLNSGDHDVAGLMLRDYKATIDMGKHDFLVNGGDAAKALVAGEVLKGLGENQSIAVEKLLTQGKGLDDGKKWFDNFNIRAGTQPNQGDTSLPPDKQIITMSHAVEEALNNDIKDPKAFKQLYATIGQNIADPKMPAQLKAGYMQFAYDPRNIPLLNKFEPDHIDPQTNKVIPGRVWLYQQLTGEGNAAQVEAVDKAYPGAGIKDKYLNYVEKAGQQLISQEVSRYQWPSLPKMFSGQFSTGPTAPESDPVKVSFDNENMKFEVKPASRGLTHGATVATKQVQSAQEYADRVNTVLGSVKTTAALGGMDVNAYIYQLLAAMGPDINPLAQKMLQAVITANTVKKEEGKK